jgi:hypothetical protein
VTIPNLLYYLIAWVLLTEDQSDRPISNIQVEISEATDKRIVSFVLDIIYNVTRGKVKTAKCVGRGVSIKILTGSADLVKVGQTLSRISDSFHITNGLFLDVENFLFVVYAFPSIGDINEVRFHLFC